MRLSASICCKYEEMCVLTDSSALYILSQQGSSGNSDELDGQIFVHIQLKDEQEWDHDFVGNNLLFRQIFSSLWDDIDIQATEVTEGTVVKKAASVDGDQRRR